MDSIGIATSTHEDSAPDVRVRHEPGARFVEDMRDAAVSAYVAQVGEATVGYLMLRTDSGPNCVARCARPLRLWRIYVLPSFHGRGVAAALMAMAFKHATDGGYDLLWLGVSEHNLRAQAFYRKHGFQVVGEERVHAGEDAHHDVIMARALK